MGISFWQSRHKVIVNEWVGKGEDIIFPWQPRHKVFVSEGGKKMDIGDIEAAQLRFHPVLVPK